MDEYEATFEIESEPEAHAVERLLDRLYDSLREESLTVRDGAGESREMLEQFATVRDAARDPAPATLTVTYERRSESFEE